MQHDRPRKLQRISQACDLCHRRSIRCRPSNEDSERCQNCYDFDVACTYDRPSKRKKHPQAPAVPQQAVATTSSASSSTRLGLPGGPTVASDVYEAPGNSGQRNDSMGKANEFGFVDIMDPEDASGIHLPWKAFALASESVILELFDVYIEVVYPLYPFFHEESERQRLKNRDYVTDKGFFSSIMAMCAVATARIRDGAQSRRMTGISSDPQVASEVFFTAAQSVFVADLSKFKSIEYVRTCSLLALASIQYNQPHEVQKHLGIGATITTMQRLYDERNWDKQLTDTQRETYRRLYWGTYSLEVYSTVVWNCFLRFQELHINIRYPSFVHEASSYNNPTTTKGPNSVSWLTGWNFAIDIYRVLEHVLGKQRASQFQHDDRRSVDSLVFKDTFSENYVMTTMLNMYYGLPTEFKTTPPMTGDPKKDIYAFQAANIQATLQLLRMMLFSLEDGPGVDRKCDVASEVLAVFKTIPPRYLRAISTPLVYQIGKIGTILGSVLEEPLSEELYQRVRSLLTDMADMLEKFEAHLHRSAGTAQKLISQIEKIDEFMESRRVDHNSQHDQSNLQPMAMQNMVPQNPGSVVNNQMPMPMAMQNMDTPPDIQLPPDLVLEWPWPLYQQGPYYMGQY